MSVTDFPTSSTDSTVRVGQLWQDMAPEMVSRKRILRVVTV